MAHSGRDRPRGAPRSTARSQALAGELQAPGPGRRGVQRRRRLGVPRRRRPAHAGCRARPRRHRRVAVAGRVRARRLPGAGGGVGPALDAGRDRRDGPGRVPDQRHRPLLPLQGRADGRPRADRRGRRRPHRAGRQRRRPRRPPARATGGQRGRGVVPARRRRVHQGRRAGGVAPARAAHVGQAGRRLPGQPGAVRDRGVRRRAVGRGAGRGRAAPAGLRPGPRPPLRRHGAHRGRPGRARAGARPLARPSSPACGLPATATSRSTSRASGPATSTADRRRPSPSRTEAAAEPWGTVAAHEAGNGTQLLGRLPRRRHPGPGPGEGRARRRLGGRGLLVRRDQPGRLPRRQDRAHRDRHRDHQRVLAHGHGRRPDRCRLRLRQRRSVHPRARGVRSAGHRGLPRRALRGADAAHPRLHRGLPHDVAPRAGDLRRPDRADPAARRPGHRAWASRSS